MGTASGRLPREDNGGEGNQGDRVAFNGGVTFRLPPAVLLAVAAAAQHLLARGRRPSTLSGLLGVKIAGWSGILGFSAVREFRRGSTTVDPIHVDTATELVRTGPFAFTRNPMYLALTGALLAHAVARRSLPALVPIVAFIAVIDRLQIPAEESALREIFGPAFQEYAAAVPRWVGAPGS